MVDPQGSDNILQAGLPAPDFTLPTAPERNISLRELHGSPVVLVFYPADWSPVCSDELAIFNQALPLFQQRQAKVLGISVDGVWCHRAFAQERHIRFDLLADFEPKGAVARAYGVYDPAGFCQRALFVVDAAGRIAWSHLSPATVNPGVDGVLDALDRLEGENS